MPLQKLCTYLQKTIHSAVRDIQLRGLDIADAGLDVSISGSDKSALVKAHVRSQDKEARLYKVQLGQNIAETFCDCRYHQRNCETCEHLVAAAHTALRKIEAQAQGLSFLEQPSLWKQLQGFQSQSVPTHDSKPDVEALRYSFRFQENPDFGDWTLVPYRKGVETTFANLQRQRYTGKWHPIDRAIIAQMPFGLNPNCWKPEQPRSLPIAMLLMQNNGSLFHGQTGKPIRIDLQPFQPVLALHCENAQYSLVPCLRRQGQLQEIAPGSQVFGNQSYYLLDSENLYALDCHAWPQEKLALLCKRHVLQAADLANCYTQLQQLSDIVVPSPTWQLPLQLGFTQPVLQLFLQANPPGLDVRLRFRYDGAAQLVHLGGDEPILACDSQNVLYYIQRDTDHEQLLQNYLAMRLGNAEMEQQLRDDCLHLNEADMVPFADNVLQALKHNPHWIIEGMAELERLRVHAPTIKFHIHSGIDWFDLDGHLDFDGQEVSLQSLLEQNDDTSEIILSNGSRGMIPVHLRKLLRMLRGLQKGSSTQLQVSPLHVGVLSTWLEDPSLEIANRTALLKQLEAKALQPLPPQPPPTSLQASLRNYQEEGLHWLRQMRAWGTGGILADDMGLGKTIQVIASLCDFYADPSEKIPSLVVMPTSLVHNWKHELDRFAPHLPVVVYHGLDKTSPERNEIPPRSIVLTSYTLLRNSIEFWQRYTWGYVILDESQAIKNPTSNTAHCARRLKAAHRLALTGTPIENNLMDLWSQFAFVQPGLLGGQDYFSREFARPAAQESLWATQQLSRMIAPFYLRRTKEKVLHDLPPLEERILYVEMDKAQRSLYETTKETYRNKILADIASHGIRKSQMHIIEGMLRLRQIACDPRLYIKTSRAPSAKLSLLLEKLREDLVENHKALVFSQFTALLELCGHALRAVGIDYAYLDGSTRHRSAAIDEFTTNSSKKVFLISLKAGGSGLNLTAADYVFHLDPWWNPAVEAQATGRAHRIGQQNTVQSIKIVASDSIEEKILQLQDHKRKLSTQVICSDQGLIRSLNLDLVKTLFS